MFPLLLNKTNMKNVAIKLVLFTVLSSCTKEKVNLTKIQDSNVNAIASVRNFAAKGTNENLTLRLNSNDSGKADLIAFRNLLKKYEVPSQFFVVSNVGPQTINGEKGTVLYIDPNDLETVDGKDFTDSIRIELKELLTSDELLRSGAQTVSDRELLVSGGSYFINATSAGKKLKLKSGRTLKAEFPRITQEDMSVYYGKRKNGVMNWTTTDQPFQVRAVIEEKYLDTNRVAIFSTIKGDFINLNSQGIVYQGSDTTTMSGQDYNKYLTDTKAYNKWAKEENAKLIKQYGITGISSFGWINCDGIMKESKRHLSVKFENPNGIKFANAFVKFKDINSVVQSYYYNKKTNCFNFRNLPEGYKVHFVAYTVKDGKTLAVTKDFVIDGNSMHTIKFDEVSDKDFKEMIGS